MSNYWRQREIARQELNNRAEEVIRREIAEHYALMQREIEKEINGFYTRYARREGITMADAMERVSKMDVQAFSAKAKKYVKTKDFSEQANRELRLYNATMRINRLELLKANIGLEMIDGFNDIEHTMGAGLTDAAVTEAEHQEQMLRERAGILGESITSNAKFVSSIVNASFHNATWSDRIWMYQNMLRHELDILLTQALIQGQNPREVSRHLSKRFGVSKSDAERLLRTELTRVRTDTRQEEFKRNGIDQYEYITVGAEACSTCKPLDGQVFDVRGAEIANPEHPLPPMHPSCRCTTVAHVER